MAHKKFAAGSFVPADERVYGSGTPFVLNSWCNKRQRWGQFVGEDGRVLSDNMVPFFPVKTGTDNFGECKLAKDVWPELYK